MKIGIMAGSRDLKEGCKEMKETMEAILSQKKSKYEFVMGPNETGVMRTIKDKIRERFLDLTAVAVEKTPSVGKARASRKIKVKSISERIQVLFEESDLVIFFPGGIGTRAEFYTMMDIKMESEIKKTLILFNFNHIFDYLLEDMNKMVENNMVSDTFFDQHYFYVVNSKEELLEKLRNIEKEDDENE